MNKKGFTLVELLAVIVILGILSLISVPMVMNIINGVEKKSTEESAYGYVEALNQAIVDSNYSTKKKINNGYYYSQYLKKEYGFEVGGYTPSDDSWVHIKNGEVENYSLKYKKYVVSNINNKMTINNTIVSHDKCFKINSKQEACYENNEIKIKNK